MFQILFLLNFFRFQQDPGAFSPAFSNGFYRKMVSEVIRGHSTKTSPKITSSDARGLEGRLVHQSPPTKREAEKVPEITSNET